jgi:hypothetical protein
MVLEFWVMDTKAVVARFEAERQALAMMDHPNIARVFDADAGIIGRFKVDARKVHCVYHGMVLI